MCFQHGKDVKPQSDITEIMGFNPSMLKVVLESFVEFVAEESADLIPDQPRFVHAVVVVTNDGREELCQASCKRQLDNIQVQQSVQAATPELDDFTARIMREISESRDIGNRYAETAPSSPQKFAMQPKHCNHTSDLLHQLDTNSYLARPSPHLVTRATTSVQFPSMNRSRGQV